MTDSDQLTQDKIEMDAATTWESRVLNNKNTFD